jgi:hypothetical protein
LKRKRIQVPIGAEQGIDEELHFRSLHEEDENMNLDGHQ